MKTFMKELIARFKAETPIFFKKVRNLCIAAAAIGTAILVASEAPNMYLPEWLQKLSSGMVYSGVISAAIAQLAKTDK